MTTEQSSKSFNTSIVIRSQGQMASSPFFSSIGSVLTESQSCVLKNVAKRIFPHACDYTNHLFGEKFELDLTLLMNENIISRVNHIFEVVNGWKSKDDPMVDFSKMDAYATMCYMLTIGRAYYNRTVDECMESVATRGHDGWSIAMLMYLDFYIAECKSDKQYDALITKRTSQYVPFAELTPEAQQLDIMIIQITDAIVKGLSDDEIISLVAQ